VPKRLLEHFFHSICNAAFPHVYRHYEHLLTGRGGDIEDKAEIGSTVVRIIFKVREETVESGPLPRLARRRDVDAPLRQVVENGGRDVASNWSFPDGVKRRRVESIDPLSHSPCSQSTQEGNMLERIWVFNHGTV